MFVYFWWYVYFGFERRTIHNIPNKSLKIISSTYKDAPISQLQVFENKFYLFSVEALGYPTKDESDVMIIALENEDMKPTILDCEYEIEDDPMFLTLKWFRDDKTIYQWIRGQQPAPIVRIFNKNNNK